MAYIGLHESRLQYHARKFSECADPDKVLMKYAARSREMDTSNLLRHICHVCAWIVLSQPLTKASERSRRSDLSPIVVLSQMLKLRVGKYLDERAQIALDAVQSCCERALSCCDADSSSPCRADWLSLLRHLPKRRRVDLCAAKRKRGERCPEVSPLHDDAHASDVYMFKRVRRLNKGILKWRTFTHTEMDERIESAEERLAKLLGKTTWEDSDKVSLRSLLYDVVGSLAKPRRQRQTRDADEVMDLEAAASLQVSARLQAQARNIVIKCITLWRCDLQLDETQLKPVLDHLIAFVQAFEDKHNYSVRHASAGKQWHKLKRVLGLADNADIGSNGSSKKMERQGGNYRNQKGRGNHRVLVNGVFVPNEKIRSLQFVRERSDNTVPLHCKSCNYEIVSSWWLEQPGHEPVVLRPHEHKIGRRLCGHFENKLGKSYDINDWRRLDICIHGGQRSRCSRCI
eukprot:TRINITY_DN8692_c1_g1_i1.p1 TRINITY_DN8692_c1_g1~~TRINITY_DN8692_c1_g1_i1.p1  ORF type:complete len:458 (+),score=33.04 TRINITY_DN8692_c1_g1_i1:105-1478(+)